MAIQDKKENENMAIQVQQKAPDFKGQAVVGTGFKEITLESYKGKWLVLFFYPLDFTFVCPTEIIAFSDRCQDFKKIGAEIVACSVDSHFTHLAWVNTPRNKGGLGELNIPLLADLDKSIGKNYGVLLKAGMHLRGLFIIDPKGTIRHQTVNDLPVGRNVDEALRIIEGFQYFEKHGEVCPANWTPGKKTMKPDPVGSQEYFKTVK